MTSSPPHRPLRVALVSEHASPLAVVGGVDAGGQNIYVAHLARCMAEAGHHVDVLTRRDAADLPARVDLRPGARVFHIPAGPPVPIRKEELLPHMDAFARASERLVRNSVPYDVVHANFFMSGLVARRLQLALSLPFVMTFHALGLVRREHQREADGFPPQRAQIERALMAQADAIIAECPQDRLDMVRLYGADPAKMTLLPCGFDPQEFSPLSRERARARLGLPHDEFLVLQLGRLVPRKGIDNVIQALALLPPQLRAHVVVVGGDSAEPDEARTPEIGRLRRLAASLGVAERVRFTGHRQRADLRAWYAAADVFVTTPWYEPFGITPLEAMACGRPVVGSAVGGIQHTVVDGVTGFLVPPKDPGALAQRLAQLAANPALGAALGRAGIRRVRAGYTWDGVAARLLDLYAAIARSRPQSAVAGARLVPAALQRMGAGVSASQADRALS